jgi:hypothetical protein
MPLKPAHCWPATRRLLQHVAEPLEILPARHGEAVRRESAVLVLRTRVQRRLEDPFHRADERLVGIVEQQAPTRAPQMRETRLMQGVRKVSIRLPPIAHEHARIVQPDERGGLREPTAGLDGVDRRQGSDGDRTVC